MNTAQQLQNLENRVIQDEQITNKFKEDVCTQLGEIKAYMRILGFLGGASVTGIIALLVMHLF